MGNFMTYFTDVISLCMREKARPLSKNTPYAIFDPMQNHKPAGRSKDIISYKHRNNPTLLDTVIYTGCDTIWKSFKRTVWRQPNDPFIGERRPKITSPVKEKYNLQNPVGELGDYQWQTFSETDEVIEALANSIIKYQLCPEIKSSVKGTPNLKMMGIFSENRLQWFKTELACCSDSICIVPIAVEE
jgi:hypothetical protein